MKITCSSISDRIRSGKLDYDAETDAMYAEEGGTYAQIQDRATNTRAYDPKSHRWLDKQPRVSSKSWGRVWKDGQLDKQFEGPKYQVRQDMAEYLDVDSDTEINAASSLYEGADKFNDYYQFVDDATMFEMFGAEVEDENGDLYCPSEHCVGYDATHIDFLISRPEYSTALANAGIGEAEWVDVDGKQFAAYVVGDSLIELTINDVKEAVGEYPEHTSQISFDFIHSGSYNSEEIVDIVSAYLADNDVEPTDVGFESVDYSMYPEYASDEISQCSVDFIWQGDYDSSELEVAVTDAMDALGYTVIGVSFNSLED